MFRLSNHMNRIVVGLMITGLLVTALVACAAPTPEVIEKEVVVEREVPVTVEVEKEVVVEKLVVETVVVEKEMVVEKVVTPTPGIPEGGTLIFAAALKADFPVNPIIAYHRPGVWVFDPLVELSPTMEPAPCLAESWTVSDDGTVYTFKLRQDVKWHDGVQFTADDVIFTFDAWLNDPNSLFRVDFVYGKDEAGNERLVQARKIDDYTAEFTLPEPRASFLDNLTGWHGIAPRHLLEGQDMATAPFNENPVGTGVLKFVELRPTEYVKYEMNKDYWRGRPHLDYFIWQVIPDPDAQVTALSNEEIDVIKNVESLDMAARVNEIPGVTIYKVLGNFTYCFFMNPTFEPFQDKRIREAMAWALDKPTIIKGVVGTDVPYAEQLLNPSHWGYNPDVRVIGYDPEKARALLREAGWEDTDGDGIVDRDGQPLAFMVMTERNGLPPAIQDYLRAVGIDMSIKTVERAVREELQKTSEWDAYIGWDGWGIAMNALKYIWSSGYWTNYSNPEVDRLVEEADKTVDPEESAEKIKRVEKLLTDDVAAIWLYYYTTRIAVSDNIGGLQMPPTPADLNNTGVFYHLEDLFMKVPK